MELDGIVSTKNLPPLTANTTDADPLQKAKMRNQIALRKTAAALIGTDVDPRNQIRRGEASVATICILDLVQFRQLFIFGQ